MKMDYFAFLQDRLLSGDVTTISIIVATVVVFISILLLIFRRGSNKRQGVLLIGLCDSGKTLLFSRLVNDTYVDTQTSVKENSGIYHLRGAKKGSLRIIDLPGYERLRNMYLDQYKMSARGIIFVIDSSTVTKDIKEVGEFLYNVLTDGIISRNSPPLLVACNKQDQTLAKGPILIKSLLEKELDTVRTTQAAALEGTTTIHDKNVALGQSNKHFEFSDLKSQKVKFVESCLYSSKEGDEGVNIDAIVSWLQKIA